MDVSVFDPVEARSARVNSSNELKVSASVPGTVNVAVAGTVNVAPQPASAGTVVQSQVQADTTRSGVVGANARLGLMLKNLDASNAVFVGIGVAATTDGGFRLDPGETLTLPAGVTAGQAVYAITASGTADVAFIDFRA